jgi:hypothetical protein
MGSDVSVQQSPNSLLCNSLQNELESNRKDNTPTSHPSLPRATKVDGRFVLTPEYFPDYIEYSSLSDLVRWKSSAEPHETYSDEYLNENLPVVKPDRSVLEKGKFCHPVW